MSAWSLIEKIAQEKRRRLEGGGDDFRGSLKRIVSIWSDPSHALIELLQNADDAGATEVQYRLLSEGIVLQHNGHPFNEDEVWAICSVDKSTKDADTHTGFMGIGFKAVFTLSDSPVVICKPYQFGFSPSGSKADDWGWIIVPRWVEELPPQVNLANSGETVFWLPYKKDLGESARDRVIHSLIERFDGLSLLFLRNVKRVQIEHPQTNRLLTKEDNTVTEERGGKKQPRRYKIISSDPFEVPGDVKEEYRVQESGRDKAKVRQVSLAFGLNEEENLQPLPNLPLYVFLPTDYRPGLHFAVQGDFILDTQRSQMDESLQWNCWLWRCVGEVLKEAIQQFKSDEQWRYQFYKVLPTKKDSLWRDDLTIVRTEMVKPFWGYCRQGPIVLTASNEWVRPEEAILASADVQGLLDAAKLEQMTRINHFVHPTVEGKTSLEDMGVDEFSEMRLLDALRDADWVKGHDAKWFCKLYGFLWERLYGDRKRLSDWRQWEEKAGELPVVKTHDGAVYRPNKVLFSPEQEQDVQLAEGIPGIVFVDPEVLGGYGRELLKKLGVNEFTRESVISSTILTGFESDEWAKWTSEELEHCLTFIKVWLKDCDWEVKPDLRRRLGAVRVMTEARALERADECYFPEPEVESKGV